MHKNFLFKGIVRSNDNILANEGECLELINLRTVNGSLRPIPEMEKKITLTEKYSEIYWHEKASCYLCITKEAPNSVDFYDMQWNVLLDKQGAKLQFQLLNKVYKIEFIGYIVVCMTEEGIRYLVYSAGRYRWLGERPVAPVLYVTPSSKIHEVNTETTFTNSKIDTAISSLWLYNSRGFFDECISKANKAGYYIDRALFRFALRLYDGSYIYTSHTIYVSDEANIDGVTRDAGNLVAKKNDTSATESTYKVKVLGFKPEFNFVNMKLDDWEGVIVGIDLFSTGSIMGKEISDSMLSVLDTATKLRTTEKIEVYKDKELDVLWNEINDASLFYKVAEFDIWGNCLNSIDDVSQSNIVLQNALSGFEQATSMSSIVPDCSYMFNNRLHVASLREYFFKGYDVSSLLPAGLEKKVADAVVIQTKIHTQNGISTVCNQFNNALLGYSNGTYSFPPLLSYPDSRAFEMSIFVYYDTELYAKRFTLTPHKYLNQAQYLHKADDITNIPFDSTWELKSGAKDYAEENVYETKENVMKVSLVENPFIFPAKCTYPLSQGKVIALSTNRAAMSEGQYGEHPLYIFSQQGIQVMAVDTSGATAYSNIFPVSHEVCCNAELVCGTDSGVLFLGTQGVMLISGNRCIRISAAVDNESKELKTIESSDVVAKIASLQGLGNIVDEKRFMDFMRNAKVVRNAQMDELLFCNVNYEYSYIYSMSGNMWSKMSNTFYGFIRAGGTFSMFSHDDSGTHIYVPGDNVTGNNKVLLLTRPHIFGTKLPKRIMQLLLHAYLAKPNEHDASKAFVSCFLLCSNDGVNFKLVAGTEKMEDTQDVLFPYFPTSSYRYFMFALAANLNTMSMITALELEVNTTTWGNRLR